MSIAIVAAAVCILALLLIYYSRTNVDHQASFTPVCPNCGAEVRYVHGLNPNARARLRDHVKECEQW